jgi:DNA-binding NarL/FixJ family response regulator
VHVTTKETIRILLADDHTLMRRGLRALLADEPDMDVVAEAQTGREAVKLAAEHRPEIVIMDIAMPDLNGIEAARKILQDSPGVKVMALSMHPEGRIVSEMLRTGASGYIVKNCALEELVQAVRAVHAGKTYLSPDIAGTVVEGFIHQGQTDATRGPALTPREREVLQMVAEGRSSKQIAHTLEVTTRTVEAHRRSIMTKLDLRSVAELTKYAIREGLTSVDG